MYVICQTVTLIVDHLNVSIFENWEISCIMFVYLCSLDLCSAPQKNKSKIEVNGVTSIGRASHMVQCLLFTQFWKMINNYHLIMAQQLNLRSSKFENYFASHTHDLIRLKLKKISELKSFYHSSAVCWLSLCPEKIV